MHQVDLNMRRQKQQSKFHTSSRFCQGTFPDDECSLQFLTKCFRCPSSNLSQLPLNLTAWGKVRGDSREGRDLPIPRTHHSELLEVFPELCLATVMRNPTNKNFIGFIVIAPGSFLLNQGGENSVRRTIRVAASVIWHWTMNNGLWLAEGRAPSSLQVSQAWRGSTFWAQRFSVPGSSEDQEPRACVLRPLTHFTLKSGEAAGCGVGWNSISPARALPDIALKSEELH